MKVLLTLCATTTKMAGPETSLSPNSRFAGARIMAETDVLTNQKIILENQKLILANQEQIKENQNIIQKNQEKLNIIIQNQEQILSALKK